jgi:hypothetical protein
MLTVVDNKLKDAKTKLEKIQNPDVNTSTMISKLMNSINDAVKQVSGQQEWLTTYLSKKKSGRKAMFYDKKVSWFGIPLN